MYRMFTDTELKGFRTWMRDCPFDRSAQGAFDAKPKARDQGEEPEEPARRGNLLKFLRTCARGMSPENWAKFREELLDDDEGAEDEPPREPPGEPAMDRRIAMDYRKRFPNAPRGVRYAPEIGKPVRPMSAAAARDYADRFPDSARIGRA